MNKVIVWVRGNKHEYLSNSYDQYDYKIEDRLLYLLKNGRVDVVWKEWSNVSNG